MNLALPPKSTMTQREGAPAAPTSSTIAATNPLGSSTESALIIATYPADTFPCPTNGGTLVVSCRLLGEGAETEEDSITGHKFQQVLWRADMCSGSAFSGTGNKSRNFTEFAKNLVRSFNTDPSGIRKAVVDATSCFEGPEHRDDPFAQNMNAAKRLLTKLDHIYRSSTVNKPQGGITLRFARPDTVRSFIDCAMGMGSIRPSDAKATEFGPPYRGRNLDDYLNRLQGLDIQRCSPTHSAYWESGAQSPLHTCSPIEIIQPGHPATSKLVFDLRPGRAGFMTDTASPGRLGKSHPSSSAPIVYPGSTATQSLGRFKLTKWKSCTFRSGEIQVTIAISCKQEGNEVIYRADVCGGVSF